MSKSTLISCTLCFFFLSACIKEEPILPQESLYGDNIIEAFSVFDPCDTIQRPAYQLARAFNAETTIKRLFYLQQPASDLVLLGRSVENTAFEDNTELYFHGLSVLDQQSNEPLFILSEDEVDVDLFAADNIYLIGQASAFGSSYLFLSSSDALASAAFGVGDLFKVSLYEIEEHQGTLTVQNKLQLNGTASGSSSINFEFESRPLPNNEEVQTIQKTITQLKAGNYPFDPASQAKKFDLQLALYQRDFRFAEGLLQNTNLLNLLSAENQQSIRILNQIIQQKSITAFFCMSDQKTWTTANNLAPGIATPID